MAASYANGEGVPKDEVLASAWYLKAAEQGHAEAQYYTGVRNSQGVGVPVNLVEAYKWMSLAVAKATGESAAEYKTTLNQLLPRLSPQQLAEGQRLAREWKAKPQ